MSRQLYIFPFLARRGRVRPRDRRRRPHPSPISQFYSNDVFLRLHSAHTPARGDGHLLKEGVRRQGGYHKEKEKYYLKNPSLHLTIHNNIFYIP